MTKQTEQPQAGQTVRVWRTTLQTLRYIHAATGQPMVEILDRLAQDEWGRVKPGDPTIDMTPFMRGHIDAKELIHTLGVEGSRNLLHALEQHFGAEMKD